MTDNELIIGIKNNDRKSLHYYTKEYKGLIKKFSYRLGVRLTCDQEDMFSEVTIAFLGLCKGDLVLTSKLSTLLCGITKNLCSKFFQNGYRKRRVDSPIEDFKEPSYDPEYLSIDYEVEFMNRVVKQLCPVDKKFLTLLFKGLNTKEIAQEMDFKNLDVVKSKKHKIIKRIRTFANKDKFVLFSK